MVDLSYKILSVVLCTPLFFMEKFGFVTDFLSPTLIFCSILMLLMQFLTPAIFNDGTNAQKAIYKKCERSCVICFLALNAHALIRHLSVRFSFTEDPIVIPMYIILGYFLLKNMFGVFSAAREKKKHNKTV